VSKNQQFLKLFLVLFTCTVVIFCSSYYGSAILGKSAVENEKTSPNIKNAGKSKTPAVSHPVAESVLNETTVTLDEVPEELQFFSHSKIEIPAQSSFSLLGFVKTKKLENISSESLSLLATAIYQTVLSTNFTIVERNIGTKLPQNMSLGFEAKVNSKENQDFEFSNPNKSKYVLELQINNHQLIVTLKGEKLPYDYKIRTKNKQYFSPKTIVQYSPMLTPGQTKVVTGGTDGQEVEVYRDTYQADQYIKSERISDDYYPPEYRVEINALDVPSSQQGTSAQNTAQTNAQAVQSTAGAQAGQTTNSNQTTASYSAIAQGSD
jgi:hypothetical protein